MFDITPLMKSIESQLVNSSGLSDVTIERSTVINTDTGRMPWIGIYPGTVETQPNTIGNLSRRWKEITRPSIVLQDFAFDDFGTESAELLEELIKNTMEALNTDLAMGTTNSRLLSMSRRYTYNMQNTEEEGLLFFPQCEIVLEIETVS